jgi:uncharacterized protein (DUF433 family)
MSTNANNNALIEITPRGPSIAGTRITVYSIMDYIKANWSKEEILAHTPRVTMAHIEAVYDYIEQHRAEVEAEYARILEREALARAESEKMLRERGLYTGDLTPEERQQRLLKRWEELQATQPPNEHRTAA